MKRNFQTQKIKGEKMYRRCFIPLVQEFYLLSDCHEIVDNKYIATKLDGRKVIEAVLIERNDIYYDIDALTWKKDILLGSVFIFHFQELLLGFIHNQLNHDEEYLILDKDFGCGIKLYLDSRKYHSGIRVEMYDQASNSFSFIARLNKPEVRIMVRMLYHYLNRGKINEIRLDGSVKCNYSGTPFFPEMQS